MLGLAGHQLGIDVAVAGRAQLRCGRRRIDQFLGLVRLVAGRAVGLSHLVGVRLVAIEALGDRPVLIVTEITGKLGVFARIARQFPPGVAVAGDTDFLLLASQYNFQRLVV